MGSRQAWGKVWGWAKTLVWGAGSALCSYSSEIRQEQNHWPPCLEPVSHSAGPLAQVCASSPAAFTQSSRFCAPSKVLGWLHSSLSHRQASTDFVIVPGLRIVQGGEEGMQFWPYLSPHFCWNQRHVLWGTISKMPIHRVPLQPDQNWGYHHTAMVWHIDAERVGPQLYQHLVPTEAPFVQVQICMAACILWD